MWTDTIYMSLKVQCQYACNSRPNIYNKAPIKKQVSIRVWAKWVTLVPVLLLFATYYSTARPVNPLILVYLSLLCSKHNGGN